MEFWPIVLYPMAFGFLGWWMWPRKEAPLANWDTLPGALRVVLGGLILGTALTSTIIAIIGPAALFRMVFHWPEAVSWTGAS